MAGRLEGDPAGEILMATQRDRGASIHFPPSRGMEHAAFIRAVLGGTDRSFVERFAQRRGQLEQEFRLAMLLYQAAWRRCKGEDRRRDYLRLKHEFSAALSDLDCAVAELARATAEVAEPVVVVPALERPVTDSYLPAKPPVTPTPRAARELIEPVPAGNVTTRAVAANRRLEALVAEATYMATQCNEEGRRGVRLKAAKRSAHNSRAAHQKHARAGHGQPLRSRVVQQYRASGPWHKDAAAEHIAKTIGIAFQTARDMLKGVKPPDDWPPHYKRPGRPPKRT